MTNSNSNPPEMDQITKLKELINFYHDLRNLADKPEYKNVGDGVKDQLTNICVVEICNIFDKGSEEIDNKPLDNKPFSLLSDTKNFIKSLKE